jgi:photosystem II stability/assembly factor-like uncharacterized protein
MARGGPLSNTMRVALLVISAASVAAPGRAALNAWSSVGPYAPGGNVRALAIDPASPDTLYAGTDGGVFKSVDRGTSWSAVNNGLASFTVYALAADPRGNSTLYAGTNGGVYKTVDGGSTWTAQRNGIGRIDVQSIVIDPANPVVLLAGTRTSGVFRSADAASTWTASSTGLPSSDVRSLAISHGSPEVLLAGTAGGVAISGDGGNTWSASPGAASAIRTVSVDAASARTFFAAPDAAAGVPALLRTNDAGTAWSDSSAGLGAETVLAIAQSPNAPASMLAGTQRGGIFASDDGGATWRKTTASPTTTNTIAIAPNGSNAYAGSTAGAHVSLDSGRTWSAASGAFQTVTVNALVMDPSSSATLYAGFSRSGSSGGGVFKTTSAGAAWVPAGPGLPDRPVESLAIDPAAPSRLYAGTSGAGVFTSGDGGVTWTAASVGLGNQAVHALAVSRSGVVWAGTDEGIFRSNDSGATWTAASDGLSILRIEAVAVDPNLSDIVYAGTPAGVFKTVNGGRNWTAASNGLSNFGVRAIVVNPLPSSTIYAGTYSLVLGAPTGVGVYKSTDSGATWSPAGTGMANVAVTALAIEPTGQTLYAGTPTGVFRSTNAGATWSAINEGIAGESVNGLVVDPRSPSTVYAATDDGVFQITIGPATPTGCTGGPTMLCLNGNRFSVQVAWHVDRLNAAGNGMAVPLTGDTGAFWFFTSGNLELVVKVVDGRAFNGSYWVFYGALSDVAYTITVTDTLTGSRKTYDNPQGQLASIADTSAFPGAIASAVVPETRVAASLAGPSPVPALSASPANATEACVADSTTLCLNANRFRVQVRYVAGAVSTGPGQTVPFSSDSGSFWFFSPGNLELNVKVVDGRAFNGFFWVFYGALSDVQYTITVTDTQTGAQRTYLNPQGRLASVADTSAF